MWTLSSRSKVLTERSLQLKSAWILCYLFTQPSHVSNDASFTMQVCTSNFHFGKLKLVPELVGKPEWVNNVKGYFLFVPWWCSETQFSIWVPKVLSYFLFFFFIYLYFVSFVFLLCVFCVCHWNFSWMKSENIDLSKLIKAVLSKVQLSWSLLSLTMNFCLNFICKLNKILRTKKFQ